ncbi:MAG TPA: TonB-dependent receptor plug domain-containing protein, partial [Flavitalea sp.]|nr:TonB-dependent receptor plug domain-containing protein [Flavitalea sp.]
MRNYYTAAPRTCILFPRLGKLIALVAISFLFFNPASAQTIQVKGVVLGPSGPLQDVSVKISGKNSGTTTDVDGRFSIQTTKGSRLIFSSVGYLERQMEVTGGVMNISLSTTNEELSEVIVTGYSAQSKKSITGSVVTVKSDLIKALPVTNVNQALQGRVAGLTIISDGSPQGNVSVRIRGVGTINGSDPLYVIDGVPTTSNLNQINPADIESASVLKDASAASVYGARAANGVVLIETKKGKVGQKPSLSFDGYVGVSAFPNRANPELLNTQQYANSLWQSQRNSGITNPTHPQFGTGADPVIPDYINPVGSFEG